MKPKTLIEELVSSAEHHERIANDARESAARKRMQAEDDEANALSHDALARDYRRLVSNMINKIF